MNARRRAEWSWLVRLLALTVACVLLSGCRSEPASGFVPKWVVSLPGYQPMLEPAWLITPTPELLFLSDRKPNALVAYHLAPDTGEVRGVTELLQAAPFPSYLAWQVGNYLRVSGFDGSLRLYRLSDLSQVWRRQVPGYVFDACLRLDELVLLVHDHQSEQYSLRALRVTDGTAAWSLPSIAAWSQPTGMDDRSLKEQPRLATWGDHVVLSRHGHAVEEVLDGGELRELASCPFRPGFSVATDDAVFVDDGDGRIVCLDLEGLTERWTRQVESCWQGSPPAGVFSTLTRELTMGDSLLLTLDSTTRELVTLDPATGDERWRRTVPDKIYHNTAVSVAGGFVVCTSPDAKRKESAWRWLDEQTGEELASLPMREYVTALGGMGTEGDRLYWTVGDGTVWCWRLVRPAGSPTTAAKGAAQ